MFASRSAVDSEFRTSSVTNLTSMTPAVIEAMSNQDLAKTIANARLPFLREPDHEQLPFVDRTTLERLIYLARQYCTLD